MIKQLFVTIYTLLFIDQKTGKPSHTKFWSNVGYACLCFTFVFAVMHGTTVDVMIWALFGVIVVGNRTVIRLFDKNASVNTSSQDDAPPKES